VEQITKISFSKLAEKQILKSPTHIKEALDIWIETIQRFGVWETRKMKGYHDEPLKGHRNGQRSVRLNRSYRVIYKESEECTITIIVILEVNKHDY
jgi:proteic killer suppression protein